FAYLDENGNRGASPFTAKSVEFDFKIEKQYTYIAPDVQFDLGIDVLGIEGRFKPQVTIDFELLLGFGLHLDKGFYLRSDDPLTTGDDLEASLAVTATFSSAACPGGGVDRAAVEGRLLFLALHLNDGVDMNGNGSIEVACDGSAPRATTTPQTEEITKLYFAGSVNIVDPGRGAAADGLLTISEIISGSPRQIIQPQISGGAMLRVEGEVDFSTLGPDLGEVLPAIGTKILIDFPISWTPGAGLAIAAPQVVIADVTLDLGSFISKFAGPILNKVADVLGPLDWLIGPDGFLNKRIPLLSDLAGKTITGKDLVVLFDPQNGPKVVAFLDFVEQLYYLAKLVRQAASEGNVKLNFGDLVLFENVAQRCATATSTACTPNLSQLAFVDRKLGIGLPAGIGDIRQMRNFRNVTLPTLPAPSTQGTPGSATSSFTSGVTKPGSVEFRLLRPETVFNLLLGKPADIVLVNLPEFGFNFFYRQVFPIIGPLVGTFAGGVGANVTLAFGYDTLGLQRFMDSKNVASLFQGFYISDVDAAGADRAEATLRAEIAVGAAISLALITAGVEGGITANIFFNLSDLDNDTKVRFDELKANVLANGGNPLAVFDISGLLEFFLRAYVEINLGITKIKKEFEFARLKLFEFDIPFKRPAFLGTQSGDTLTLAIGPNSQNRLQGVLDDIGETIFVSGDAGNIKVWSDQFNRSPSNAQEFSGVRKIVANGGAGDDVIDLGGIVDVSIAVELDGGDGNDTLIGGAGADTLRGGAGND
ncbi:MAG TPA: hypothetical protein VK992_06850, partial [Candidatus Caenarcaniphilales bacterium]|nr:hypothetical protein [Candidatus Caenarcaniphilales bacterium]